MKYMTQSIASTTWVALNRSRIFFLPEFALFIASTAAPVAMTVFDDRPRPCQVLTTFRCDGEFDWVGASSDFIAASTPPARCGTPAAARPISTPDTAPIKVSSLHSPRWPMRNTLPASLLRPEPSDMLYPSSTVL